MTKKSFKSNMLQTKYSVTLSGYNNKPPADMHPVHGTMNHIHHICVVLHWVLLKQIHTHTPNLNKTFAAATVSKHRDCEINELPFVVFALDVNTNVQNECYKIGCNNLRLGDCVR